MFSRQPIKIIRADTNDVGRLAKIAGRNHEEMDGDANGQRAVPMGRAVSNKM